MPSNKAHAMGVTPVHIQRGQTCHSRPAGKLVLSSDRPRTQGHSVIPAPPAPPELSRNVLRPVCGSVGPCPIWSCLSWQTLAASLKGDRGVAGEKIGLRQRGLGIPFSSPPPPPHHGLPSLPPFYAWRGGSERAPMAAIGRVWNRHFRSSRACPTAFLA